MLLSNTVVLNIATKDLGQKIVYSHLNIRLAASKAEANKQKVPMFNRLHRSGALFYQKSYRC